MAELIYRLTARPDAPCGADIRWLTDADAAGFNAHLRLCGQAEVEAAAFRSWYARGIRYCLLYADGVPAARGAVEPYSDTAWEAADIRVAKPYRGRGLAKEVLRFLSGYIVAQGRTATCRTAADNTAMHRVMKAVGYTPFEEDSQ